MSLRPDAGGPASIRADQDIIDPVSISQTGNGYAYADHIMSAVGVSTLGSAADHRPPWFGRPINE